MKLVYAACGVDLGQPSGGAFMHVVEVLEELQKMGWDVVLVGLCSGKPSHFDFLCEALPFSRERFLAYPLNLLKIVLLLHGLRSNPSVEILYVRWGSTALSACLFAEWKGIPYFIEMNGIYHLVESNRMSRIGAIKSRLLRLIEKVLLLRAKGVFTTTRQMADYYIDEYGLDPKRTFPNACGVNPRTHLLSPRPTAKSGMIEAPVIGYAGGLWKATGVDCLLQAAPLILKEYPGALFLIAGKGEDQEEFKKIVDQGEYPSSFRFLGQIPYDQVPDFLKEVDIAVAPYRHSPALEKIGGGTPTKIYTYLACGKLTVISDLPYYQHFRQCPACLFFKPSDPADLALTICKALTLPVEKVEEMVRQGRQFILDHYTWRRNAQCVDSVLRNLREVRVMS